MINLKQIGIVFIALSIVGILLYDKPVEQIEPPIGAIPQTIEQMLAGKTAKQKANIKGLEIAKIDFRGEYISSQYGVRIDIIEINAIEGGVEVFAKAWKQGKPLGFGKDGSVEIERFLIYNPPVLVDDPNGSIVREWTDGITRELKQRKLREDPAEAIRQVISHNVTLVGKEDTNIIKGKVGNTTSTFFADAGGDGTVLFDNTNWNTARVAVTGEQARSTQVTNFIMGDKDGATFTVQRGFFPLNTSGLPDGDTIDSATFSLYQTASGEGVRDFGLILTTQASLTALLVGDYDAITLNSPAEGTNARVSATASGSYKDFVMNSTGIGWIDATGNTLLGVRNAKDIDDSQPSAREYAGFSNSDETGTSQDPKLVVEHSEAVIGFNSFTIFD